MTFKKPFRAVPIKEGKVYRRKRRYARAKRIGVPVVVLAAAAAIGTCIGLTPSLGFPSLRPGHRDTVSGCTVTDGDTIRCNGERIRLLGIDAPELPGHCRTGRNCAPGDGYASKRSLADALVGTIRISRVGEDHYGRTLAILSSDRGDLSCWQLEHGQAIYKPQSDDGRRVARICPKAVLLSN
ncbi:thermonuclease family protein [Sphingomonas sp. NIC1]|uniref:thermonuclease family protein n=1 Tax=Sphingomonas sp. NIC1 TaxID=1961362 RepID=UPI00299DBEE2|nr:thermonuclease family protein [Sphingomonas sp. NIC1]